MSRRKLRDVLVWSEFLRMSLTDSFPNMTMKDDGLIGMKRLLILLAPVLVLTGCVPFRQGTRINGGDSPPMSLCDDRYVLVGIDIKREKIITEQSHIVDPKGKRYAIEIEPHQYDIDEKFKTVRVDVYPCNADGSRIRRWSNGIWSFHFVAETDGALRVIDQQWKYWTFYYSPICHGPPN